MGAWGFMPNEHYIDLKYQNNQNNHYGNSLRVFKWGNPKWSFIKNAYLRNIQMKMLAVPIAIHDNNVNGAIL